MSEKVLSYLDTLKFFEKNKNKLKDADRVIKVEKIIRNTGEEIYSDTPIKKDKPNNLHNYPLKGDSYYDKYLKYKIKYLELKKLA